jgi:hypothetical protein
VHHYEEEKKMPYLSSIERLALQEGEEKGYRKALLEGMAWDLSDKFGQPGRKLLPRIRSIEDLKQLRGLARQIKTAKTLDEVRRRLP